MNEKSARSENWQPADWIIHARMVETIAKDLECSAQTVRRCLHRFDALGIEGLGDRPRSGRPAELLKWSAAN